MIRLGILILCVSGCLVRHSAGSFGSLPEPEPRIQGSASGTRNQVPFNPIYIPVAETPVSQSIQPFIGPSLSTGIHRNGLPNLLPFPNGPNVPFPGTAHRAFPGRHPLSGRTTGVPVIDFNDFLSLIRRGTVTHSGPINGGQDLTYVDLGSLIPNAPEVAIPSISLPATLRRNSGTAVSHETTQIIRGSRPLGLAQTASLTRGTSPGLLSSALANINQIPRIPLHPIAALHQAQSLSQSGLQQHPLASPRNSFFRVPNNFNNVPNSASVLHHIAANNGRRHFANAVHQTSNQLQGRLHPAALRSLSNAAASIPRPPFHAASILNPAVSQSLGSIQQIPVPNGSPLLNNGNVQSVSSTRFVHQQSRFVQSPNIVRRLNPIQTGNGFFPERPSLSSRSPPFSSNARPIFSQRTDTRSVRRMPESVRSGPNTPLTVNRPTISRTPGLDARIGASTGSEFARRPLADGVNGFVRRSSFDDFIHRSSPIRSGVSAGFRADNVEFDPESTIPRGPFERQFPDNPPRSRTVDSPRGFMDRSAFTDPGFTQPRSRLDPRDSRIDRRDFPRPVDPLPLSRNSGLPSTFDERIQQEFARDNFALPRQFDPAFSAPTDPGVFDAPFLPDDRSFPPRSRTVDSPRGFMDRSTFTDPGFTQPRSRLDPRDSQIDRRDFPRPMDPLPLSRNSGLPSTFDERIHQEFARDNFALPRQFDPTFSAPTDPGIFDAPFLPDDRSFLGPNRISGGRPLNDFVNDIPRPVGVAIPPNRDTFGSSLGSGGQFRDPAFDVGRNQFTDDPNLRFSSDNRFEPRGVVSAPPFIPSRILQPRFSDPRPIGIAVPSNRVTPRQISRDPGMFRGGVPFSGSEFGDFRRNGFADPQNSRLGPENRFESPRVVSTSPFDSERVLQPPFNEDRGFQTPIGRINDPSMINPVNDFPRPIGISNPAISQPSSSVNNRREGIFSPRNRFGPFDRTPVNDFPRPIGISNPAISQPSSSVNNIREGIFSPRNRFGPFGRTSIGDRFDRDRFDSEDRIGVRRRFPLNDPFVDPFDSTVDFFDNQGDDRSFTSFFHPRFSPLVRSSGPQFSVSPVSREMTRFFQRSPVRRPRGSFLISFLVNVDDVTSAADDVGFDVSRGVPPGFQNRFFPRDSSSPFNVNGPTGEDINRLEEIDVFENQRGSNRFNDFGRPFQRPPISEIRDRGDPPLRPGSMMSSIPFAPPLAPSPASRILPPRPAISSSFPQLDPFTDTNRNVRLDSRRFQPMSRPLPLERPPPRPFALAIPDPDGPRNQPFLTAAIEGQFDGPTSSIDINDAFNRRQPSIISEPVVTSPQRRIGFSQFATGPSQVLPGSNALNAQHLLTLGNSIVHSHTSQNILTSPGNNVGSQPRTLMSPVNTIRRGLPLASQSSILNFRQTSNFGRNANLQVSGLQGPGNPGLRGVFRHNGFASHRFNSGVPTATNSHYVSKKAFGR